MKFILPALLALMLLGIVPVSGQDHERERIGIPPPCNELIAVWSQSYTLNADGNEVAYVDNRSEAERAADARKYVASLLEDARRGDVGAQTRLAFSYADGSGVPQDYIEAARWFRLAADQGYANAQYHLGVSYKRGRGVQQSYAEALRWYRLAIDQGDTRAMSDAAWLLATVPDSKLRNGTEAILLAQKSDEECSGRLDTLAAAYAETGNFSEAVQTQQQAVEWVRRGHNADATEVFELRLSQYRAGLPWREDDTLNGEYVTTRTAELRAAPSGEATLLQTLAAMTAVRVEGVVFDQTWAKVILADRKSGYVQADSLRPNR